MMRCRPIILGSLNCITENIQVNDACKCFPKRPYVDQPWLRETSARFIHSEDCERLIFIVHLLLLIRVLFRQGTVNTAYPWTIHSAPPLQLTQKDVSKFNRYFPPHTKLHFVLVTYKLRLYASKRVSQLKTYVLIFCGSFVPMNLIVFVINQTVFQHMQWLLPPALLTFLPKQEVSHTYLTHFERCIRYACYCQSEMRLNWKAYSCKPKFFLLLTTTKAS